MSTDLANLEGRTVDRYEVGALLGRGGFGAVYRARHAVVGTEVALKVLWAEHARDPKQVERFLREARAAAGIGHPSIVRVLDAGTSDDGIAFLAMERLEGQGLEARLDAAGALAVSEAVPIVARVLDALGAAHAAGIVHRDLKPGNVFLTADGGVKLLDFGISKVGGEASLTATGLVLGTPPYMAPEQLDGRVPIDGRVDLYAAATMLYELLSGEVPFPGQGYDVIVQRLKGARPPPLAERAPHVPATLVRVIERGLALDRDARFPDAASLKNAIEAGAEGRDAARGERLVATVTPRPSPLGGVVVQGPGVDPTLAQPRGSMPVPTPAPGVSVHPPSAPSSGEGPRPWAPIAALVLAMLLATGVGVLGVLLYRLSDRDSEQPGDGRTSSYLPDDPSPPLPAEEPEPALEAAADVGAPAPVAPVEVTPPATVDPASVRYDVFQYTGAARPRFDVVLEDARPAVARCALRGRPVSVAVQILATYSGAINIAQPHPTEASDDPRVARCVASAIQASGPARFNPAQSAVANIRVDLPAG